jgi:hypothetical protein
MRLGVVAQRAGNPRALHATLNCKQIASEKFAAWRAELQADRSARHAMRDALIIWS